MWSSGALPALGEGKIYCVGCCLPFMQVVHDFRSQRHRLRGLLREAAGVFGGLDAAEWQVPKRFLLG